MFPSQMTMTAFEFRGINREKESLKFKDETEL